jgi:hypothetical protein
VQAQAPLRLAERKLYPPGTSDVDAVDAVDAQGWPATPQRIPWPIPQLVQKQVEDSLKLRAHRRWPACRLAGRCPRC